MNFRDYKHFSNPRGLRNNGPYTPLDPDRYTGPKMGWAKLVVGGSEHVAGLHALIAGGCMPIVQIYRERMGAAPADEGWYAIYEQYIGAGARWFELYDEPNADHFWPLGKDGQPDPAPDWVDHERCIAPVMDNWLDWAERIVELGAYPAFPAMAETTVPEQASVAWVESCLSYLVRSRADRFGRLIASGMWCAVHPFVLNHFYQEPPGGPPTAARPFYQQTHQEGGWHFEYPYDPLQQHDDPGRTAFGGTAKAPFGDPNGLIACGQVFTDLLKKIFGSGPVPVIGTAGGISPIPAANDEPIQPDSRYYGYSRDSHGQATLAMFNWLAEGGPPWFFGLTLSAEADYYPADQPVPAIDLLRAEPPATKSVPDVDILPGRATAAAITPAPEASLSVPPPEVTTLTAPEPPVTTLAEPLPDAAPPGDATDADIPTPTVLWPAPEAREEVHAPAAPPVIAMPPPASASPPGDASDADIAAPTVLWPAPEVREEVGAPAPPPVIAMPPPASASPPEDAPDADIPAPTVLWPAPETREEVHTPAPAGPPADSTPTVATMELPPAAPAEKLGPGPGPVSGVAAEHWLMPASDLPPGWFFGAARAYWDAFRLPVVADASLIGALPPDKSLAVTLLASRAGGSALRQRIAAEWPNVQIDLVAGDTLAELQAELDRRAHQRQEYGS